MLAVLKLQRLHPALLLGRPDVPGAGGLSSALAAILSLREIKSTVRDIWLFFHLHVSNLLQNTYTELEVPKVSAAEMSQELKMISMGRVRDGKLLDLRMKTKAVLEELSLHNLFLRGSTSLSENREIEETFNVTFFKV